MPAYLELQKKEQKRQLGRAQSFFLISTYSYAPFYATGLPVRVMTWAFPGPHPKD